MSAPENNSPPLIRTWPNEWTRNRDNLILVKGPDGIIAIAKKTDAQAQQAIKKKNV